MTYQVTAIRTGDEWVAVVPDLDLEVTARNLLTLDRYVRTKAADVPEAELDWSYDTGDPDTTARTAELRSHRAELQSGVRDLAQATAEQACCMSTAGWSTRDIGVLLGISYQQAALYASPETPGQPPG